MAILLKSGDFCLFCYSYLHLLFVYKQVIVHFLPVGHTHEDVDQLFSRISLAMKGEYAIYTLDGKCVGIEMVGCKNVVYVHLVVWQEKQFCAISFNFGIVFLRY